MNIIEITTRIRLAEDSQKLDRAILNASDFIECGEGDENEIRTLFQSVIERIGRVGDREEALNCLSKCAIGLGSVRESDLANLISLMEEFEKGELLLFINILSNADQAKYLDVLRRLAENSDKEISAEAIQAMEELRWRVSKRGTESKD